MQKIRNVNAGLIHNVYVGIFREYNNEYNTTDESILCKPTEYAKANGISISNNGYSPYWFLTLNKHLTCYLTLHVGNKMNMHNLAFDSDGKIYCEYSKNKLGVRPEIHIMLKER